MNKTPLPKIINEFLTACAESEGITEPIEIEEYIKNRKEDIQAYIVKKDAE